MHLPAFTAEVSVYRSTGTYRSAPAAVSASGAITPQAYCGGYTPYTCCRACGRLGYRYCTCTATHCVCFN